MKIIKYLGMAYNCNQNETVLDALLRQGAAMPFSCRKGTCQTCLSKSAGSLLPQDSQKGLRQHLRNKNYFLPCKCNPAADMVVEPPRDEDIFSIATVIKKEKLIDDVYQLLILPSAPINYRAGQFINIRHPGGQTRSYSIASVHDLDYGLELHIKRTPGGLVSNWIFDELSEYDAIEFQGPFGDCYYTPGETDQNMLLVGTGTGLAPLLGIIRDAFTHKHEGKIFLYHGTRILEDLYLHDKLMQISRQHSNFHYNACLSGDSKKETTIPGRANEIAFANHKDLNNWRVYLCGNPDMVISSEILAAHAGAKPDQIHMDAFKTDGRRKGGDPALWAALSENDLLVNVLVDFYTRVYSDDLLSPYFRNVSKQQLVDKQYSFLRQLFSGELEYSADRPGYMPYWVGISDELFKYRETLMKTVLKDHNLPDGSIEQWRTVEESFRKETIKSQTRKRIANSVPFPLEGFNVIVLNESTLCDTCQRQLGSGEKVLYHVKLDEVHCYNCQES